ncbi:MAG: TlpA disulfide reductase family protein [Acidiferrobacterales bacterium]
MKEKTSAWRNPRVVLAIIIAAAVLGSITVLWPKPSQKAPAITFTLITGNKLSLQHLRGRPVLVFFWATTCKICIAKTPDMNSLYQQLKPEGLEMIAVAMPYDPPTRVVAVAKKMKMPYPVALDINAEVVRAFDNVTITPTTILIAPNGNITWRKQGKFDIGRLKSRIRELNQNSTEM